MNFTFETPDLLTLHLTRKPNGTFTAHIGDHIYEVALEGYREGAVLLRVDGQLKQIYMAPIENHYFAALDGQQITFQKSNGAPRRVGGSHAGDLTASMPGQVIEVMVAPGEMVEKGQTLVLLEAMKMELRIRAPYDGVVKQVLCVQGNAVERGQLLVELEAVT